MDANTPTTANIGDRFRVLQEEAATNAKGRILAKFRPEFDYRVTPQNIGLVNQLIAKGKAVKGGHSNLEAVTGTNQLQSEPATVKGFINVKPKAEG